ncbi:MAG: hypothetical protein ACLRK7_08640 [Streptococcus salivarius]|jgi:hypothetical protein
MEEVLNTFYSLLKEVEKDIAIVESYPVKVKKASDLYAMRDELNKSISEMHKTINALQRILQVGKMNNELYSDYMDKLERMVS